MHYFFPFIILYGPTNWFTLTASKGLRSLVSSVFRVRLDSLICRIY